MLTELQRRKLAHLFQWHDQNHDGYLEQADLVNIVNRFTALRGWASDGPEHQQMLPQFLAVWQTLRQVADSNRDDRVSLDEWLVTFQDHFLSTPEGYKAYIDGTANLVRAVADVDGDGALSHDEYGLFFQGYGVDVSHLDTVFAHLDTDGDGVLDVGEVQQRITEFFTSDDPAAPGNWLVGPL